MPLLLDTYAMIWIVNGDPISEKSQEQVRKVEAEGFGLNISAITAWEIAMLSEKGRIRLTSSPITWIKSAISDTAMAVQPLSIDVLTQSADLPGNAPSDPADRMIIATAREHDLKLVTRDRRILDYGASGLVKVMAC